jgi:substrate import-associated zinc metallohydrolase lipoprotein
MKIFKIAFVILAATMSLASCKKEEVDLSQIPNITALGGDTWAAGPIDKWIADTLTTPFNIAVKYKWDQFEDLADITKTLVPPDEAVIVPILSAVKKVWIDSYINEASLGFFKNISPKFFYLIGSPAYESNGGIKLGVAEGGRKIILLNMNEIKMKGMPGYQLSDSNLSKQMFHTIHHEFAHIMHQNVIYPVEFKNINPNLITANWQDYYDYSLQNPELPAWRDGFISAYAMNTNDDDFVETVSLLLVNGQGWFDDLLASIPAGVSDRGTTQQQAITRLRTKESIVVTYFKEVYGIDFYKLQSRVRGAIESVIY